MQSHCLLVSTISIDEVLPSLGVCDAQQKSLAYSTVWLLMSPYIGLPLNWGLTLIFLFAMTKPSRQSGVMNISFEASFRTETPGVCHTLVFSSVCLGKRNAISHHVRGHFNKIVTRWSGHGKSVTWLFCQAKKKQPQYFHIAHFPDRLIFVNCHLLPDSPCWPCSYGACTRTCYKLMIQQPLWPKPDYFVMVFNCKQTLTKGLGLKGGIQVSPPGKIK